MSSKDRAWCLVAILVLCAAPVLADTYGLPPSTGVEAEWKASDTALVGTACLVARSRDEWSALWRKHDPRATEPPAVDFSRDMVVALVTTRTCALTIYRTGLDDAAAPTELVVRAARATRDEPVAHFVAIAKSALPVRFVLDDMVDGRMYGLHGGVDETPLGRADGLAGAKPANRAEYREQAEKAAVATLTPTEIAAAKKALWPASFGTRYPELWSAVRVHREATRWTISYDHFSFEVDVVTGAVERK